MSLVVKKVRGSKCRKEVKRIYHDSFPKEERMPFFMMCFMSWLPSTEFLAFYDQGVLCGFLYYAVIGGQIFIMFLAVDDSLRGRGYGSQILTYLRTQNPIKKIIVSIEPCQIEINDVRQRRKSFYNKNDFISTGYMLKLGSEQELLISNGSFSKIGFRLFLAFYSLFTLWPKVWKFEEDRSKNG